MKERFDEKSQDIYIWLSQGEFDEADNPNGKYRGGFERLVNENKRLVFLVGRTFKPEGQDLDVKTGYSGFEDEWTSFSIQINDGAWDALRVRKWARDRYDGGPKVTILVGDPEVEGLDAISRDQ